MMRWISRSELWAERLTAGEKAVVAARVPSISGNAKGCPEASSRIIVTGGGGLDSSFR
jgi:hypothetical protein